MSMNVNGVTGTDAASAYSSYNTTPKAADTTTKTDAATNTKVESGVVYEPSTSTETESATKTYKQDTALIAKLKAEGAELVLVFGIGRMCHIAFWEPHFADEFSSEAEWKQQCYRIGAKLHPLTIEQNALTSFKSRTTLVPCRANTIGPGLFLQADYIIGGADGVLGRGMQWQGMSFLTTLHYGPDMSITSTYMPTLPGKLFYLKELAGPLVAECN